jgi:hypothetical protein
MKRSVIIGIFHYVDDPFYEYGTFIPELSYIALAADKIEAKISREKYPMLINQIKTISRYANQYGLGIIPYGQHEASGIVESLYRHLLKANIPLPPQVYPEEFQDWLKEHESSSDLRISKTSIEVPIKEKNLGLFAKILPWVGKFVSLTLTGTMVMTSAPVIASWGWSNFNVMFMLSSRLLSSYLDIVGGSEKRFQKIGEMIDRIYSNTYRGIGKYSTFKQLLYLLTSTPLLVSALISWAFAYRSIYNFSWLKDCPEKYIEYMAKWFASCSAVSMLGRTFNPIYYFFYTRLEPYLDFSQVQEQEKISYIDAFSKLEQAKSSLVLEINTSRRNSLESTDLITSNQSGNEEYRRYNIGLSVPHCFNELKREKKLSPHKPRPSLTSLPQKGSHLARGMASVARKLSFN